MGYSTYTGADVPTSLFPDHTDWSVDGTAAPEPSDDEQISRFAFCDICSTPLTGNWKPHEVHGRTVCKLCIDPDNPPRPDIDYDVRHEYWTKTDGEYITKTDGTKIKVYPGK